MSKELKAYIVGINFSKYTLLNKIHSYLSEECKFNVEYIEWLGKKNIDRKQYEDGDIYIYVEVENIYKKAPYMMIEADEDKKSIANKFKVLLVDIEKLLNESAEETVDTVETIEEPEYIADDNALTGLISPTESPICVDKHVVEYDDSELVTEEAIDLSELPIVVDNSCKKSSLVGVNVIIDDKEYYITKEDFVQLYELDDMLTNHGYKLSSIVVSDENPS